MGAEDGRPPNGRLYNIHIVIKCHCWVFSILIMNLSCPVCEPCNLDVISKTVFGLMGPGGIIVCRVFWGSVKRNIKWLWMKKTLRWLKWENWQKCPRPRPRPSPVRHVERSTRFSATGPWDASFFLGKKNESSRRTGIRKMGTQTDQGTSSLWPWLHNINVGNTNKRW